jgi:hypothetical protein
MADCTILHPDSGGPRVVGGYREGLGGSVQEFTSDRIGEPTPWRTPPAVKSFIVDLHRRAAAELKVGFICRHWSVSVPSVLVSGYSLRRISASGCPIFR